MSKKSIRFFNDREVRAVWDEEHNKWWFSATDIVRAINDEEDYVKAGNYWRWLKGRKGKQLTSDEIVHYQLKVTALHRQKAVMEDINAIFKTNED